MTIGDNIKKLRIDHGLDQVTFGQIAGVSDKAVSSWENNNSVPRMGVIEKIANYFNITKSAIIEDTIQESIVKVAYNGSDTTKLEIKNTVQYILNNIEDETQLKQIKMFLETYI